MGIIQQCTGTVGVSRQCPAVLSPCCADVPARSLLQCAQHKQAPAAGAVSWWRQAGSAGSSTQMQCRHSFWCSILDVMVARAAGNRDTLMRLHEDYMHVNHIHTWPNLANSCPEAVAISAGAAALPSSAQPRDLIRQPTTRITTANCCRLRPRWQQQGSHFFYFDNLRLPTTCIKTAYTRAGTFVCVGCRQPLW